MDNSIFTNVVLSVREPYSYCTVRFYKLILKANVSSLVWVDVRYAGKGIYYALYYTIHYISLYWPYHHCT